MTKSSLVRPLILAASLGALAGCGSIASTLGLERHVPDETQVAVHPALTLPPEYDLMPPGTPTAVSAEHETGAGGEATASAQPQKEERGFFSSMVHGFGLFDSDDSGKATTATATTKPVENPGGPTADINGIPQAPPREPASDQASTATPSGPQAPGPDVNGTPQPDVPAAPATPQAQTPPPQQQEKPGFFSRLFDWF